MSGRLGGGIGGGESCWKSAARRGASAMVASLYFVAGLYYLLSSPPLHLLYEPLPPAGPNSVYVPGGGFSGFWWHLGYFQRHMTAMGTWDDDDDNSPDGGGNDSVKYYCYSSGCLSLIVAHLNTSVDDTYSACQSLQNRWLNGSLSRYDLVSQFLEELLPLDVDGTTDSPHMLAANGTTTMTTTRRMVHTGTAADASGSSSGWHRFLSRLHVLVTTTSGQGVEAVTARNREHLVDLLLQTTWIPLVTGRGLAEGQSLSPEDNPEGGHPPSLRQPRFLDGGFSRALHPECQHTVRVPNTWESVLYTLHPGMDQLQAYRLWEHGNMAPPLPDLVAATATTTSRGSQEP